jgi:ketosteroid isomerase-like protein
MIDREFALEFAAEWVRAWNAHDLERIFAHYADDFEMVLPFIVERMG